MHAAIGIVEELETALDVLDGHLGSLALLRDEMTRHDQVARVAQAGLLGDLGKQGERVGAYVDLLLLGADGEDLLDLFAGVGVGTDDDDAVEEVERQAVRAAVAGAADAGVAAVGGHDDDGGELGLERAVDVAEALDVEHVDLVDEEDAGHDLGLTLLAPLADFGVDLVADLAADLAGVAGEEGQEALRAAVDHVDLVE